MALVKLCSRSRKITLFVINETYLCPCLTGIGLDGLQSLELVKGIIQLVLPHVKLTQSFSRPLMFVTCGEECSVGPNGLLGLPLEFINQGQVCQHPLRLGMEFKSPTVALLRFQEKFGLGPDPP